MDSAEAIAALRQLLDIKQNGLAEMLGVTVTSISRYENGREPSRQVLKKLADVAKDAKLPDLQNVFTAKWKASITARLKNLRSAGTERAVALDDLKRWHGLAATTPGQLREIRESYIAISNLRECTPEVRRRLQNTTHVLFALEKNLAGELSKAIELYIAIPNKKGQTK